MNCSTGMQTSQDALGCLAGHLLAAKLSVASGADPCISDIITMADNLLIMESYVGPSGSYSLPLAIRRLAITLSSILDVYTNRRGCP